jgi:uncharacterized protein (TIGR02677 family)
MNHRLITQSLRKVPELSYVNAENVARYRAIMRFFYQEYQRLRYWMKPAEVYEGVRLLGVLQGYTLEQCHADLDKLVEWKNLTVRHDGGRATTIEEYMRKKYQYSLTPYSIEIERLLETLESVTGYGGSLEPTLFDTIAEDLFEVRNKVDMFEPGEALELWERLYQSFVRLHENSADYIASLQTVHAETMMMTEEFLVFKERLRDYLQNFMQALQHRSYKIEDSLLHISREMRKRFLACVAEDAINKPRIEEMPSKKELIEEYEREWENLHRWFVGAGDEPSESTLLEQATKEAIARIVHCVRRIQERKRKGLSRRQELDFLAKWFYSIDDLDEAHRLAAYTYGLFATRHLQGEDRRESDRSDMSMWEEIPTTRSIRSRSRKRISGHKREYVRDQRERRQMLKQTILAHQQEESALLEEMLRLGRVRIDELGMMTAKNRLRLLQWIGRCMATSSKSFRTPEGMIVSLKFPSPKQEAVLRCEDGVLTLPNYELRFVMESSLFAFKEAAVTVENE